MATAVLASAPALLAQNPFATAETPQVEAQRLPENRGANALATSLKKLRTWASVMMITAHPDDEDGGLLTYLSRGQGARASLFTLTRGEGGQNVMSAADYEALGLIRTNELLRADRYYGVEQRWGTVADYGFSKTMEEALGQWGRERVLYDAVRAVRMYRPLVVTSVFVGGVTDGHGHHQVAGMLAQLVFKAAADPKIFPDQIAAGLEPWAPLKVYERVPTFSLSPQGMYDYATGKWAPVRFRNYVDDTWIEGAPSTNVEAPEGTRDAVLGQTYFQIGRRGLGEQRSQHEGPNVPLAGAVVSAYHRYGSRVQTTAHEQTFFDGVDTSLPGMVAVAHGDAGFLKQPLGQLQRLVDDAFTGYNPVAPEKTAPLLAQGYQQTVALLERVDGSSLSAEDKYNLRHELEIKRLQFNEALAEALGVRLNALVQPETSGRRFDPYAPKSSAGAKPPLPLTPEATQATVTPGAQIDVRLHVAVAAELGTEVVLKHAALQTPAGERWTVEQLQAAELHDSASGDALFRVTAAADAKPTAPYFSRPSVEQPYYDLSDPRWRGDSFAPYPLAGVAEFEYRGVPVRVSQVVQTMHRELGLGAVYAPLMVAPRLSVTLSQRDGIVPKGNESFPVSVRVHSEEQAVAASGTLSLELPPGWQATPAKADFHMQTGEEQTTDFVVHSGKLAERSYVVKAVAESKGQRFDSGYETAGYPGIIPYPLYRPAQDTVRGVDVQVAPHLNVGYVMGTGDDVPGALEQMGVHTHLLSSEELLTGDLSQYSTIVLGIRAYSARPELAMANARLLAYLHQGGTLVAQYMSAGFDGDLGPYPFHLGGNPEKVVDEHAPVVLLKPEAPLLNSPNHITEADFNGWVEERGHSFMESWSPEYVPLLEMHDPGQDPQRGGLLVAHYGKGTYIYAGLALYRQTSVGVPGAFRILANLVSAGRGSRE
ncbi:MAG: PIG-L family deacetylase [Acidobacteriaceae bacterium]